MFINIDYDKRKKGYKIYLSKPNKEIITNLDEVFEPQYGVKLGNINELSFNVPYYIDNEDERVKNENIDLIMEKMYLKIEYNAFEEWLIIDALEDVGEGDNKKLVVTAFSNAYENSHKRVMEAELQAVTPDGYFSHILQSSSWGLGTVDPTFATMHRSFDIGGATVLESILEGASTFGAIIDFDSENKKINLLDITKESQYRGLKISYKNFLQSINRKRDVDSMATRLYVYGAEDMSISNVNPTGMPYLEDFSFFLNPFERDVNKNVITHSRYMSDELAHALLDLQELTEQYAPQIQSKQAQIDSLLPTLIQEETLLSDLKFDLSTIKGLLDIAKATGDQALVTQRQSELIQAQTAVDNKQITVSSILADIENLERDIANLQTSISVMSFTPDLVDELNPYIIESEFRDDRYIDEQELYDDGLKSFEESKSPSVVIEASIDNIMQSLEEDYYSDKIVLGDMARITDEDMNVDVKSIITELNFSLDENDCQLVIANEEAEVDGFDKIVSLLYSTQSSTSRLENSKHKWDSITEVKTEVDQLRDGEIDAVRNRIVAGVNESVIIDDRGVVLSNPDFPNELVIMQAGVIALSTDGGENWSTSITPDGIIADTIIGKLIAGNNLLITNDTGTFRIDSDGLTVDMDSIKIQSGSGATPQNMIDSWNSTMVTMDEFSNDNLLNKYEKNQIEKQWNQIVTTHSSMVQTMQNAYGPESLENPYPVEYDRYLASYEALNQFINVTLQSDGHTILDPLTRDTTTPVDGVTYSSLVGEYQKDKDLFQTKIPLDFAQSSIQILEEGISLNYVANGEVATKLNLSSDGVKIDGRLLEVNSQTTFNDDVVMNAGVLRSKDSGIVIDLNTGTINLARKLTINAVPVATTADLEAIELQEGKSAYELAVINGYTGTEIQWLESLNGKDGSNGIQGPVGENGLPSYTHIAWADTPDGMTGFTTSNPTDKMYMGVYTDSTELSSSVSSKYDWNKVKGEDGLDAPLVKLYGESQIIKQDKDGNLTPPTSFYVYGESVNTSITEWTYSVDGGIFSAVAPNGVSRNINDISINPSIISFKVLTIRASDGIISDSYTVAKAIDGATGVKGDDAYTILLSNESHTFAGDIDSAVVGNTFTDILAYKGTTRKPVTITNVTGLPIGMTHSISNNNTTSARVVFTVSQSMVSLNGTIEILFSVDGNPMSKRFSYSVALKGDKGATGEQGIRGIEGAKGTDGLSSYTHIAYANDSSGTSDFSTTDSNREYIGVYVDNQETGSTVASKYSWTLIKGSDGANGLKGDTGANGLTSYVHFAWANNSAGTTGFSTTISLEKLYIGTYTDFTEADSSDPTKYHWTLIKGDKGDTGSQGVGISGVTEYYLATSLSSGITRGASGWTPTIQTITETNKYLWNYERIDYTNGTFINTDPAIIGTYGIRGADGSDGTHGRSINSITEYYLTSSSNSGILRTTTGWTTNLQVPTLAKKYLWNYEKIDYTNPTGTEYIEPRIIGVYGDTGPQGPQGLRGVEGLQGPQGQQGIEGPKGIDGLSSYTHIAYADNFDGTLNFSHGDSNREYIGMYTNNSPDSSIDPTLYNWSLIRGADGSQGIQGPQGIDGQTPYFHTAWANNSVGSTGFSTTVSTDKIYIGTYTDFIEADSTDPTKYNWVRIKGDKGDVGDTGVGIQSITEYYRVSSSNTGITAGGTGWLTSPPTMTATNKYLWNYEKITYTNGSSLDLDARVIGIYGDKGVTGSTGATGTSIDTIEEFYLTSSSASGITTTTSGWTTNIVAPTPTSKYLWNYEKITYKNPLSVENKSPRIIGVYGDQGIQGPKGDTGSTGPRGLQGIQGPEGNQGIQGPTGANGLNSYTHIAYATNASGANFSHSTFANATYIGMYVDNTETSSGVWSAYEWTLIKGSDGANGIQGPKGDDGQTPYFHTAWANSSTGTTGFSTTVSTDKLYIGTYTDFIEADSQTASIYNWTLIKGDKGDTGATGPTGAKGATGAQGPTGATGTSVDSITEYYLATTSASGVTTATSGWGITMQTMTTTNKYLWNYEKINFSDGSSQNTIPVIMGVYGNTGATGSTGATGRSIVSVTEHYLATSASSGVTRTTGGWSTAMQPTTLTNKYLWNYEAITWSSGTITTYVEPIIIGVHGDKGDKGDDGKGILSAIVTYQNHTSGVTAPTGTWSTSIPTPIQGRYLWTRTITTYTDSSTVTTYSVAYTPTDGQTGTAGKGISSTAITYQQSTSGTVAPTGTWTSTLPVPISGRYLWTRTIITYTDSTSSIGYSTSYYATDGQKGDKGDTGSTGPQGPTGPQGATGSQGPKGDMGTSVDSITEYYLATSSSSGVTTVTSGWTTTLQPITSVNKYLWNYEKINFSDNTSQNTIPVIMGVYGDQGPQGATGSTGSTGATGRSITGVTEYYLATSLASGVTRTSPSTWSTTMQQTTPTNKYLWNYEKITWSSGVTTTYVEPIIIGIHGDKGDTGDSAFMHIAYADSNDGSKNFSIVDSADKLYMGTYTSNSNIQSQTPASYDWKLFRGSSSQKLTWVTSPDIKIDELGGLYRFQGAGWDDGAYSKESYTDGCFVTWKIGYDSPINRYMVGLTADPAVDDSYGTIDYAIYVRDYIGIYENGVSRGSYAPTYSKGDVCSVTYDNNKIRYYHNGDLLRELDVPSGLKLYVDSSFEYTTTDAQAYDIFFGPMGSKGDTGSTGPQGPQGVQGVQGPTGANGVSQYVHIRYSANSNGNPMTTTPQSTTAYIGLANITSATAPTSYASYTWTLFKGPQGATGGQGIQGPQGTDGTTTYTWVKYADDENGSGISDTPDGKRYIGLAFNKTTQTESNTTSLYSWTPLYDNVIVGGRNFVMNSSNQFRNSSVSTYSGGLSEDGSTVMLSDYDIVVGDTVTFRLYLDCTSNTLKGGRARISLYRPDNTYGTVVGNVIGIGEKGYSTVTWKVLSGYDRLVLLIQNSNTAVTTTEIIPYKEAKLEKGNVATDWSPSPEDIEAQIGTKADQENVSTLGLELSGISADLEEEKKKIISLSTLNTDYKEIIDENTAQGEEAIGNVRSLIGYEDPEDPTKNVEGRIPLIETNMGGFTEKWNFLETNITMGEEGIFIGKDKTGIMISPRLGTNPARIDFVDGGDIPVAEITEQHMKINRGIFVESAQIGEHKQETLEGGHTVFTWV